jgi:hypothetical protein
MSLRGVTAEKCVVAAMEVHSAVRVLDTVFRPRWQGGQHTACRDIERPTMAATSQSDVVPIAWVAPRDPDWWDTHSENIRQTPRGKVSHLISSALINRRSARPVGDAIKSTAALIIELLDLLDLIRNFLRTFGQNLASKFNRPAVLGEQPPQGRRA